MYTIAREDFRSVTPNRVLSSDHFLFFVCCRHDICSDHRNCAKLHLRTTDFEIVIVIVIVWFLIPRRHLWFLAARMYLSRSQIIFLQHSARRRPWWGTKNGTKTGQTYTIQQPRARGGSLWITVSLWRCNSVLKWKMNYIIEYSKTLL